MKKMQFDQYGNANRRLPKQCVLDCSHQGPCDEDVAAWIPKVQALVESDNFKNKPTAESIRAELKEYGAWDADELMDDAANWNRLVWCAANNVAEYDAPDCSAPSNS